MADIKISKALPEIKNKNNKFKVKMDPIITDLENLKNAIRPKKNFNVGERVQEALDGKPGVWEGASESEFYNQLGNLDAAMDDLFGSLKYWLGVANNIKTYRLRFRDLQSEVQTCIQKYQEWKNSDDDSTKKSDWKSAQDNVTAADDEVSKALKVIPERWF